MRILIEKVLKLLEISFNTGRFELLSLAHPACISAGFCSQKKKVIST